ncbi:MAG: alpha/beta hydrolase [Paracoccaceae bacterium]
MQKLSRALTAALATLPFAVFADQGSFASDGVEIHYTDEGTGPAVVYLHALGGTSTLWESAGLAPLDGRRTITFDARGHGASDKPTGADAYGARMVDDLAALLEDRGIDAAHIVGYSMGAETALAFAVEHPERVLSLTVAGSGWSGEVQARHLRVRRAGAFRFGHVWRVHGGGGAQGVELTPEAQAGMMALLTGHGIDPRQQTAPLAAAAAAMPEIIDLTAEDLARFDFPVLGLAGEADEERANVEKLASGIADYRFVMIPEADHLMAPLSPVFAETVREFLTE